MFTVTNPPFWSKQAEAPVVGLSVLLLANALTTGDSSSIEDWIDQDTTDGQANNTQLNWDYTPSGGASKVTFNASPAYWEGTFLDWQQFYNNNYSNTIPIDGDGILGIHTATVCNLVSAPSTTSEHLYSLISQYTPLGGNYGCFFFISIDGTSRKFVVTITDPVLGDLILEWGPISLGTPYQVAIVADNDSGAARFRLAINSVVMDTKAGSELLTPLTPDDSILSNPIPRMFGDPEADAAVIRFHGFFYTSTLP